MSVTTHRQERRAFHTLDGLRGVAALLVVTRHAGLLASGVSFPETYLAVDLFFLLSGFVIAFAYDGRLSKGRFTGKFFKIRLIRLYPLYALGLFFGILHRLGSVASHTEGWNFHRLIVATLAGAVFASSVLNAPTWTLLPELVANLIYAFFFRWLTRSVLAFVVTMGAVGVIACRIQYGTLDAGWDIRQLPVIASRLAFSFFGGVLLFRLVGDHRRTHMVASWASVLVLIGALCVTPAPRLGAAYELFLVLALFPLLIWAGCQSEPTAAAGRLFRLLGLVSYGIYVIHAPTAALFANILKRSAHLDLQRHDISDIFLLAFGALLIVGTWLIDAYYDSPIRKALSRRLL